MRKLIGGMALAVMLLPLPATAQQRRTTAASGARHELGVDLGLAYVKPQNISGGIVIQTPVDVRFGFVPRSGNMMWEARGSLFFSSVGGNSIYTISPGVNVLFANSPGRHRRGMYLTGGAGLVMGDLGGGSGTAFQINAGVGWRKAYGSAAWRYELGFQYTSDNANLGPSTIAIGGRIGISLWH